MTMDSTPTPELRPRPLMAMSMLCWREIVRFFRQRNRVVGAVGQPVLFWLLFSAGFDRSFRLTESDAVGPSFREYYFPGTLVLILLFTAIFATISIIEDRREGFLQSVLVAPLPRWSMVLGKVLGGSIIASLQGLLFLLLAFTLDVDLSLVRFLLLAILIFLASAGLTSLGFLIAWRMESTQGFHAIMSLFLMPMWLLSGGFFPVPVLNESSSWGQIGLHWVMRCNPLTYAVAGVHQLLFESIPDTILALPSLSTCWLVVAGFTALTFGLAWKISASRITGDLL